jgi:DNA end-binding protein Ku
MPPRPIASGTISFGLVSIPVKLFSATQPSAGISFNLLHKKCGSRLKQHYTCTQDGETVERSDMVKGYEFAKDRYVMFTPEELKAIEEKSTQAIEIAEFVPVAKIDPVYFDKPYYLGPEAGAEKAYRLLAEAMEKTGRAALARYAARGKQYLVLLRPLQKRLVMQQLLYADEVRPFDEVPIPNADVKEPELKLAVQLIDQITSDAFKPDQYADDVRTRVQELIQRKVEGQEISVSAPEPARAQVIDLMEALKASLGKKRAPATEEEERKPAKRAASARAAGGRAKASKD